MDETAIEAKGLPAQPDLERIAAAKTRPDIARLFWTIGFASLFDVQLTADLKDRIATPSSSPSRDWACRTGTIT
jgi:hypothetical protein